MAEYIEREALRSKAVYMHGFGNNKYVPLSAIENAPAADVAPVVRCRDCANTCEVDDGLVCVVWGACCNADEFCSRAERKDGDGNG